VQGGKTTAQVCPVVIVLSGALNLFTGTSVQVHQQDRFRHQAQWPFNCNATPVSALQHLSLQCTLVSNTKTAGKHHNVEE
jgi:transcriptional regulator of acetoin/glycerol metabolism